VKDPSRITDAIPSAKVSPDHPNLLAVPHKPDEVRVLRNLGIDAPAPIQHYYDWPGRFTPYVHQRATAAFLTMHKKAIVLNDIGCVDADTEYLTPQGWRRIADYTSGAVAQYLPHTGAIEFVEPDAFVKKPCANMIRFKTHYGVDQLLSPEHRVLYADALGKPQVTSAASVLATHDRCKTGWRGRIITTCTGGGAGVALTDAQLQLQVAVCADGHLPSPARTRCVVRLKRQRKKDRLRMLLAAAGVTWKECSNDTATAQGFTAFTFDAPLAEKSYAWAWAATQKQLTLITSEIGHWDGSFRKAGGVAFFSRDKESADFIQYAFSATGRTASLSEHIRNGGTDYVVYARNKAALLYVRGISKDGIKAQTIYEQPSTDGYKYCFMVPSTFLLLRRNGCIFATGNTGKTSSALWAADYLMREGLVRKCLIISPLSTLERVWADEIFKGFPARQSVVLYGAAARRKRLLKANVDFYIINHDGFEIISEEAQGMFDLVLVDEAAVLRNPSTDRFKYLRKYMANNPDARLWLMTGTPTPNEPTDAWTLAKLIESPALTETYTGFREKVMMKIGPYRYVPRPSSPELVSKVLHPSVRYSRDECLDLPDTQYQTRKVPLTKEQQDAYKTMVKHLLIELQSGDISAANEAVKSQKLIQIACGVAYDENSNTVELPCAPRVNAVKEVIEEAGGKVIVFAPLTGALEMLNRELTKAGYKVGVVNGAVSANERNRIFHEFQNTNNLDVLLAHPATMAHGLTLTASSTIVWYGPITSNEVYTQANGRIERIGKKKSSVVVHIEATELEHRLFDRLQNKQKLQGVLLDIIQGGVV